MVCVVVRSVVHRQSGVRNFVLPDSAISCRCLSYDYASVFHAHPSQSSSALFWRSDLVIRTPDSCHGCGLHIVFAALVRLHVSSYLPYRPAGYTEFAGPLLVSLDLAWCFYNFPELPMRLISPAGLSHLAWF